MDILIIKNGVCDTDIDKLLSEINNKLTIQIKCSKTLDYESFDIKKYYAVIILGGSQSLANKNDIIKNHTYLIKLIYHIKKWCEIGVRILGICLGAQLIASALGHSVIKNTKPIIGYDKLMYLTIKGVTDNLLNNNFNKIKSNYLTLHNDRIIINNKSSNLDILCNFQHNGQIIPYVFKYKNVYGVQFHPDITPNILQTFCSEFAYDKSLVSEANKRKDEIHQASILFFTSWLNIIEEYNSSECFNLYI
jgi:GMP synthase-like glutamine amidotransferase